MKLTKKHISILFNFFDQGIGIKEVTTRNLEPSKLGGFLLTLRFSELCILYGIYYIITKAVQFVYSYFSMLSMEEVEYVYFAMPILYLMEVGSSKLYSLSIINSFLFLARASVIFLVIVGIDRIIVYIFSLI